MKRFSKKLMALFLCLAMVMGMSMSAFADDGDTENPYGTKQTTRSTARSEGKKASDVIVLDIPDATENPSPFDFFLDPNGLVADSKGARFLATLNTDEDGNSLEEGDEGYVSPAALASRFGLTADADGKYNWSSLGGIYFAKKIAGEKEPVVGDDTMSNAEGLPKYEKAAVTHTEKLYYDDEEPAWYKDAETKADTDDYDAAFGDWDGDPDNLSDAGLTLVTGDTISIEGVNDDNPLQAYSIEVEDSAAVTVYADEDNNKVYGANDAEITDLTTIGITTAPASGDLLVIALKAAGFKAVTQEVGGSIAYGPDSTELKIINKSNVKVKVTLGVEVTDLPEGVTLAEKDDFSDVTEGAALYLAMVTGEGNDAEATAVVTEGTGADAKNVAEVETHVDAYTGAYELLWDASKINNGYKGYYYAIPAGQDDDEDAFGVMPFHMTAKMNNDAEHKADWADLAGDFDITVTWECLEYEASGEDDVEKPSFKVPTVERTNTIAYGNGSADFGFTAPTGEDLANYTLVGVYWAKDGKGNVVEANQVTTTARTNGVRITKTNAAASVAGDATHLIFVWNKADTSEGAEAGALMKDDDGNALVAKTIFSLEDEGT